MYDFNKLLQKLQESPRITKSLLDHVSRQKGAYILWLDTNPPICLKVGIAGPRQGKGLQERLLFHFLSNPDNTVLARHMEADIDFGKVQGYDFRDRVQRQQFLANKNFFQVIPLPNLGKEELRQFERFLESQLNPRYKGRVARN
jgi:hypothetical protein